jgi:hypothetical protein
MPSFTVDVDFEVICGKRKGHTDFHECSNGDCEQYLVGNLHLESIE